MTTRSKCWFGWTRQAAVAWYLTLGVGLSDAVTSDIVRRRTAVVEVFERVKESVVNISTTQIIEVRSSFGFDSLFNELFDFPQRVQKYEQQGMGSGFVVHPDGYIVTNAHVVAQTAKRKIIFADGTKHDARIVAIDHRHDLAILKIIDNISHLQPIKLGTSIDLMVGETVIAIGNALGYQHTVTTGVISAMNRELRPQKNVRFTGLIQTDASINPGNSGGPLLNVLGQLIGINTAIRADGENIGFAIPVDHLRQLLPELLYDIVTGLQVSTDGSCKVVKVAEGSPAANAGIRVDDKIVQLDGQFINTDIDYHVALIGRRPSEGIPLRVRRGTRTIRLVLEPAIRPPPDGGELLARHFGLTVVPLTEQTARSIGLPQVGLLIKNVEPGGPAHENILRGDVMVLIGNHPVTNLDRVGLMLEDIQPNEKITITTRRRHPRYIEQSTIQIVAR